MSRYKVIKQCSVHRDVAIMENVSEEFVSEIVDYLNDKHGGPDSPYCFTCEVSDG